MLELRFGAAPSTCYRVMCLGAPSDHIEIGCSGTLMKLCASGMPLDVTWIVFSADDERENEARCSADVDHRVIGELTWNTFRDHLILEYEIPKYDGDQDLFLSLMRLRGMQARSPSRFAEGFYSRKLTIG